MATGVQIRLEWEWEWVGKMVNVGFNLTFQGLKIAECMDWV